MYCLQSRDGTQRIGEDTTHQMAMSKPSLDKSLKLSLSNAYKVYLIILSYSFYLISILAFLFSILTLFLYPFLLKFVFVTSGFKPFY